MDILGVYDKYEWDHCEECGYVAGLLMSSQSRYVPTEVHDQQSKVLVVMVARDEATTMIAQSNRLARQQRVEQMHHSHQQDTE